MSEWSSEDIIYANDRFKVQHKLEPAIDIPVSKIVGKTIYQHDPRLIKLICNWKRNKPMNSLEPDNFLKDEDKVIELKQVLSQPL